MKGYNFYLIWIKDPHPLIYIQSLSDRKWFSYKNPDKFQNNFKVSFWSLCLLLRWVHLTRYHQGNFHCFYCIGRLYNWSFSDISFFTPPYQRIIWKICYQRLTFCINRCRAISPRGKFLSVPKNRFNYRERSLFW